jgi:hypothetical protein
MYYYYYWTYESTKSTETYSFHAQNMLGNAEIFKGTVTFEADQLSRSLDAKIPPFAHCAIEPRHRAGPKITFDEEVVPLGRKVVRAHLFSWAIEGNLITAPQPTTWWLPYDFAEIMRYGNTVNSSIPADTAMAEFPPEPWGDEVTIRIKSNSTPPASTSPIPAGGPQPLTPPTTWQGPALGTAPAIDPDAAALVNYSSPNTGQDGTTIGDLPPDPSLLQLRGQTELDDTVHKMIGSTTRKDYPLMIGISLPIADQSYDVGHEAQLWEEVDTDLMFTEKHAEQMYTWLRDRFASRSMHQLLPAGMPESGESFTIQTWKDGKAGYILFTPQNMIATAMAESETQVMVEYDNGYMREGIGNAYTIQILYDDFMALTQNTWEIYPAVAYRRLSDGTIVHNCARDYRAG